MTMQEWNDKYNASGITAENAEDMNYGCERNLRKAEEALNIAKLLHKGVRKARQEYKMRKINLAFANQAYYELLFEVER